MTMNSFLFTKHISTLLVTASVLTLSACAVPPAKPVTVAPQALSLSVPVTDQGGLSKDSIDKINTMLHAQGRIQNQVITITPLNSKGTVIAQKLKNTLSNAGAKSIKVNSLPAIDAQADTESNGWDIELRSEAIAVNSVECGQLHPKLAKYPFTNEPYYAMGPLGCAIRNNMAKMVSDPKDLILPQVLDSADGTTAAAAVQRYQTDNVKELKDIDFDD